MQRIGLQRLAVIRFGRARQNARTRDIDRDPYRRTRLRAARCGQVRTHAMHLSQRPGSSAMGGRFIAASVLSQPHAMTLYPTGPGETRTIALGPLVNHAFNLGGVTFSKDGGRFLFTASTIS